MVAMTAASAILSTVAYAILEFVLQVGRQVFRIFRLANHLQPNVGAIPQYNRNWTL
jgi:hypothetical protein